MYCKSCGLQINDEAVICTNCGVKTDNFEKSVNENAQIIEPEVISDQKDESIKKALIVGYITALLIPFVGLIVGIYVLAKNAVLHGVGIITLSLVAFLFYLGL